MADSSFGALHNWGVVGVWACVHVVDGLFMRPLSRPLGVVRIRWGICRRGWCGCGGCQGISRDTVVRRLAYEPCGWRPTILHVSVRRYQCPECAHVWRHTPHGDRYVTVILDLTPVHDHSGPSRLLDMVPGRSKQVFKTWLASQPHTWREGGHGPLPRRTPRRGCSQ